MKTFGSLVLCVLGGPWTAGLFAQDLIPTISSVINAASYASGSIAPGEVIAILGSGLGPDTPIVAIPDSSGVIPLALGDTTVYFDGTPVPVLSASATKVIALVPYGVSVQASTSLRVGYQGVTSDAMTLQIAPAAPGLYTADGSGMGQARILNVADPLSNPAALGSTITILITGGWSD